MFSGESQQLIFPFVADLLDFGQILKAFGNNYFAQISHILGQFFKKGVKIYHFSSEIIFGQLW